MAANVNAKSAGVPCPLNSQLMFARVSRAMSPTQPKYETGTIRQLGKQEAVAFLEPHHDTLRKLRLDSWYPIADSGALAPARECRDKNPR
jgi:hypothetical protein